MSCHVMSCTRALENRKYQCTPGLELTLEARGKLLGYMKQIIVQILINATLSCRVYLRPRNIMKVWLHHNFRAVCCLTGVAILLLIYIFTPKFEIKSKVIHLPSCLSRRPRLLRQVTGHEDIMLDSQFKLPWPDSISLEKLKRTKWIHELYHFVRTTKPPGPITLVASDSGYVEGGLNWLIKTKLMLKEPMENVLIVTNDEPLHRFLSCKNITILHVPWEDVVLNTPKGPFDFLGAGMVQILVVRVGVIKVLNHWGYDVRNYDADAIIMRNPQHVYEQYPDSDVVGTYGGMMPLDLYSKWGVVLCMGAVMFRSTNKTKILWETFGKMRPDVTDDQIKMNLALQASNIKWTYDSSLDKQSIVYEGIGSNGLKVTLLPPKVACRHWACLMEKQDQYYIWHRGTLSHTMDPKTSKAKSDGVWFLREDWVAISNHSNLTGHSWLKQISTSPASC